MIDEPNITDPTLPSPIPDTRKTSGELVETAIRPPGSAPLESINDEVQVHFDWLPSAENSHVTFQTRITRKGQTSAVDFEIDLAGLRESELQELSDFLSRRQAGLTTGYEVTRTITWLLDLSLRQQQPDLGEEDRCTKVRALLLSRR